MRNADENTRRDAMALVLTARELDLDGPVAYGHVREFAEALDTLKATTPGQSRLVIYPPSVEDFVRMFPAAYSPRRTVRGELQMTTAKTPARSTHRLMQTGTNRDSAKCTSKSSDTQATNLMNMMKGFMLGTHHEIPAGMSAYRSRRDATPTVGQLAIADGCVDRSPMDVDGKSDADALFGNVEALRASARSKLESAFAEHGASFAPAEEAVEDDDAEEEEEENGDEEPPTKTMPAACHKKPAAAPAMKRPSGAPTRSGVAGTKWKKLTFYRRSGAKKGEAYHIYQAPWGEKFTSKFKASVHANYRL